MAKIVELFPVFKPLSLDALEKLLAANPDNSELKKRVELLKKTRQELVTETVDFFKNFLHESFPKQAPKQAPIQVCEVIELFPEHKPFAHADAALAHMVKTHPELVQEVERLKKSRAELVAEVRKENLVFGLLLDAHTQLDVNVRPQKVSKKGLACVVVELFPEDE